MIANPVFADKFTTIFEVMSRLAIEHEAINLGQGFPEGMEPPFLVEALVRATRSGPHQYPPMLGLPELRQAVAAHDKRFYGLDIDWRTEVLVTSGATEALADCLFGLITPGDEVILIEPFYDSYLPILRRAGGVPKIVRLQPPEWSLPAEELTKAFTAKTKLMILNSPMNPTGKVFRRDELALIAGLAIKHDVAAICDEVYEHLVYDGLAHIPLMTLPGMRERCIRIGSAGKSFSVTGWKVGYAIAAPSLLGPVTRVHQFLTFATPPNLQMAVAEGMAAGDAYFADLIADLTRRRDFLAKALTEAGLPPLPCHGSYFLTSDVGTDDDAFCRELTIKPGVASIPVSAFYAENPPRRYARFCFAKRDETLKEAAARLRLTARGPMR